MWWVFLFEGSSSRALCERNLCEVKGNQLFAEGCSPLAVKDTILCRCRNRDWNLFCILSNSVDFVVVHRPAYPLRVQRLRHSHRSSCRGTSMGEWSQEQACYHRSPSTSFSGTRSGRTYGCATQYGNPSISVSTTPTSLASLSILFFISRTIS